MSFFAPSRDTMVAANIILVEHEVGTSELSEVVDRRMSGLTEVLDKRVGEFTRVVDKLDKRAGEFTTVVGTVGMLAVVVSILLVISARFPPARATDAAQLSRVPPLIH
ncbi:hypothetical protein T492DRAFT_849321 [Pavlovales sp. CCMP2436]|nr:hypothetical protein T492DRAFT_849321 [Pavlovales sp. CCMP2436]